jgi:hypothetical protein
VKVYSRGNFGEMFDHVKLHNTACMMAATPAVIHSVFTSISVCTYTNGEIGNQIKPEELGELLANFHDPFIRRAERLKSNRLFLLFWFRLVL